MKSKKRSLVKDTAVYLVLVGVPLLGLLWILRVGERIDPPPAIGGPWSLDDGFARAAPGSCAPLDFPSANPSMTISQSGRYLQLRFNDAARTALLGTLEAGTLTARQALPTGEGSGRACGETAPAELRLRLDGRGEAARLTGRWESAECEGCPALDVVAVRVGAD